MIEGAFSLARLLHFASTLSLFGGGLFLLYGYRPQPDDKVQPNCSPWPRSLLLLATAIGVASALMWLAAEADLLTGAWTSVIAAVRQTRFGLILALRALALALLFLICLPLQSVRTLAAAATILGGLSVASLAWTGHGSVGSGLSASLHTGADALHLLAAGVWVGALVSSSVQTARVRRACRVSEAQRLFQGIARFAAIAPAMVAILTLSGLVNAWYLIGPNHLTALFDTPYGLLLLVKLALFLGMLPLAAINRFLLVPRLRSAVALSTPLEPVLEKLRFSLLAESAVVMLLLAAVGVLGTLEPPI